MITFSHKGNFNKTKKFLEKMKEPFNLDVFNKYGKEGVRALIASTPKSSGETANSWSYEIERTNGSVSVIWKNSHIVNGVNIAIILQYGHGTRNGGYVVGRDYINPAIQPLFDQMAYEMWKEVKR